VLISLTFLYAELCLQSLFWQFETLPQGFYCTCAATYFRIATDADDTSVREREASDTGIDQQVQKQRKLSLLEVETF